MSVTAAAGFRAGAATAGLKASWRPDVALVVNDGPSTSAAAVLTSNRCRAHPVLWTEQVVADGRLRAVALNSGGANCFTGPQGFTTTHATAEHVADLLGCGAIDVAVASTGLIGELLDRDALLLGVTSAHLQLEGSEQAGTAAAQAIMTTDTCDKQAVHRDAAGWTVGGMAKGAGMLAPALATMLCVLTTDADVDPPVLDAALRRAARLTFDRVDTDGCTSTNDTVVAMASGASGIRPDPAALAEALTAVCATLARALVADAEGAEHEIAIEVAHAASEDDAVDVARSVARSALLKTAVFGRDPNWGRVLAAIGTTTAVFDPLDIDVTINGVRVCVAGAPGEPRDRVDLTPRAVTITVDLHAGQASATVLTTDLTHAYVHENSAYTS